MPRCLLVVFFLALSMFKKIDNQSGKSEMVQYDDEHPEVDAESEEYTELTMPDEKVDTQQGSTKQGKDYQADSEDLHISENKDSNNIAESWWNDGSSWKQVLL